MIPADNYGQIRWVCDVQVADTYGQVGIFRRSRARDTSKTIKLSVPVRCADFRFKIPSHARSRLAFQTPRIFGHD
jgi:hypothetical protein